MSGYRFLRTDDLPLIVDAYERCAMPEERVGDDVLLNAERLKIEMRRLDLWASSCMVAFTGDDPVGVLISGKRDTENLIYRVAVHPDERRAGHGKHILASLSRKLSILGPRRLRVEIPASANAHRSFLEACRYELEAEARDLVRAPSEPAAIPEIAIPVTLDDLVGAGAIDATVWRPWMRTVEGLGRRRTSVSGLAIASGDRIEAFVLLGEQGDAEPTEVLAVGSADGGGLPIARLLLDAVAAERGATLSRASYAELSREQAAALGFEEDEAWCSLSRTAAEDAE